MARVQTVTRRRLRMSRSVTTVWRLLRRHGWSWQAPARRALERDEHAVELWKKEVWPQVNGRTTATCWCGHLSSSAARSWWPGTISTPTWPPG
ncbi:winged helix-turn-helix domain-containing protein [Streptomyces sp. NBC_00047]|uniref:helix-turn-helix domain-containing protein n=1 Tax=Streptomyces sp. NBC_00047 TaxID=2975627 RepID=UPI0022513266|nr:winged helix-turn-helix domain-containing protein [Streptomyces sp. NBC_00047]MCX5613475.1 winged helix-turn-helix domain-containing protein [Streptomyces sp. NBC_00047]